MSILGQVGSYITGFAPQMILGTYIFSLNTAAFQELDRSTEYRWVAIDRHGQDAALQYTGPGADTIELPGVVYPSYRGGGGQIDKLRALASLAQPQSLIDGAGNVYGRWVITAIHEKKSEFAAFGQPLKQEFTISLRRYDGGPSNLLASIISALNPGGLVSGAQQAISAANSATDGIAGSLI